MGTSCKAEVLLVVDRSEVDDADADSHGENPGDTRRPCHTPAGASHGRNNLLDVETKDQIQIQIQILVRDFECDARMEDTAPLAVRGAVVDVLENHGVSDRRSAGWEDRDSHTDASR